MSIYTTVKSICQIIDNRSRIDNYNRFKYQNRNNILINKEKINDFH